MCVIGLFVPFCELAWSTMGELDSAFSSLSVYGLILLNSNIGITPTYLVLNYSALECGASAVSIVLRPLHTATQFISLYQFIPPPPAAATLHQLVSPPHATVQFISSYTLHSYHTSACTPSPSHCLTVHQLVCSLHRWVEPRAI